MEKKSFSLLCQFSYNWIMPYYGIRCNVSYVTATGKFSVRFILFSENALIKKAFFLFYIS